MPYQGKITEWTDDRGFGFVTPNGGGAQVFLHIKSFARPGRRPVLGDVIGYRLGRDAQGRACAQQAEFQQIDRRTSNVARPGDIPLAVVIVFFATLIYLALSNRMSLLVVALYAAASALSFGLYAWDKKSAQAGGQRIAENSLHLLGLAGGWPGALVAQRYLRHKSKKQPFRAVYWITVIANLGVLVYLFRHANGLLR